MSKMQDFMTVIEEAAPFMDRFNLYLEALVQVRGGQNTGISERIAASCGESKCATTFGNGHIDGEHDLDEMLPDAVSIAVGSDIDEIAAKLREAVDPNDYAYAADEDAYYHVPTVLSQSVLLPSQ